MSKTSKSSKPAAKATKPASAKTAKPDAAAKARGAAVAEIETRIAAMDACEAAPAKASGKAKPATAAKTEKPAKPANAPKAKKVSALDAAAQVLAESKEPKRAKDLIEMMAAKGLWTSPGGKTPESTLYAAIIREIGAKGTAARFKKHERGVFVAGKGA